MEFKFIGKDNKIKYLGNYLKNGAVLKFTDESYQAFNNKGLLVEVKKVIKIKKTKKRGNK